MKTINILIILSFLCVSSSICHALDNKRDNMSLESIASNNEIDKYYAEVRTIKRETANNIIEIKIFKIRDENNSLIFDRCPYYFAEVSTSKIKKYQALGRYLNEEPVLFLENPENILCLNFESRGTGSGNRGYYLFSLEKDTLIQNIGVIGRIGKRAGEKTVFYNWNNIFEITKYFSHASSPGIMEYYKIQKAKLVKDTESKYYEAEIEKLQKEIGAYPKEKLVEYKNPEDLLLNKIIRKYLCFRFIDKEKEGWEVLKKDLHFYNDTYFSMDGDFTKDKQIEISKIEADLRRQIDEYDKNNK